MTRSAKKIAGVEDSKVYLIAVDHAVQWNNDLRKANDFKNYLVVQIEELQIELIAEEFSHQALKQNNVDNTIAGIVAEQFGIKHVLCDPDKEAREDMDYQSQRQLRERFGVKSAIEGTDEYKMRKAHERGYWPVREKYWICRIKKETFRTAAFIYGHAHSESFPLLLSKLGYEVAILECFDFTQ